MQCNSTATLGSGPYCVMGGISKNENDVMRREKLSRGELPLSMHMMPRPTLLKIIHEQNQIIRGRISDQPQGEGN